MLTGKAGGLAAGAGSVTGALKIVSLDQRTVEKLKFFNTLKKFFRQ